MVQRILGINGIRSDGSMSTDLLLLHLRVKGFDTLDINYPRVSLLKIPFLRLRCVVNRDAKRIVRAHRKDDCIIGHSYGCLLIHRAMQLGAKFDTVIWFAPAIDKDMKIPEFGCKRLFVIYNEGDRAMGFAKRLKFHAFGEMGRTGYVGPTDDRVINIKDISSVEDGFNHSHYFDNPNIDIWANWVKTVLTSCAKP